MFFITGITFIYNYPIKESDRFYHPVIADNEGEAKDKVRAYYEARGLEVTHLQVFETIK